MFRLKAIFFVAALSVVNAAITVNIYNTDGKDVTADKEDFQEVHGCTNQVCDQLCRLLSFPGGACYNGRCKCNKIKPTEGLEETIHLESTLEEASSCNNQACDQLCQRLKFPGGACVNGRCKCNNLKQPDQDLLKVNNPYANEKENGNQCNNVECETYCQKLGLPSGYCYQDRCICYKKKENDEAKALQRCDVVACNEICLRLNYIGGMCRNGSCYCY